MDFFKFAQPDLDTKPGTVARDLFIDAPASQLSILYDELSAITNKQSLRLVVGTDLDKLAKNFGIVRKQATFASGVAILTFSSINAPISISAGSIITSSNGLSFTVSNGVSVVPAAINFYRSVAAKYRDQLDFAGIDDTLAVLVNVSAAVPGSAGNIGTYSLNRASISGVSNVTNSVAFSGGSDQENDAAFRNRVLSSFSGSSVGTALGYLNVALSTDGVIDAIVVGPGNALMTRDGTIVEEASDGTLTILSEGSGGKIDIVVMGDELVQNVDSFIYIDKSNTNDPTSAKNDVVLGQIAGDENKTINRRRIDNLAANVLPSQPVKQIIQVSGTSSGTNFVEKTTDFYGRVFGNYELITDEGVYGGSPFGFDTFHWISDRISLFSEDLIKGQASGQDNTTFTSVIEIPNAQQNVPITNENSTVTSNRSIIQLLHTPATNVTRVFNVNTGERYIITNQNFDETDTYNYTGRIQISGNTLPSTSDLLQVDYNWIVDFDQYSDYDGLVYTDNARNVADSIDWGLASTVKKESVLFTQSVGNNFYIGNTSFPVDTVLFVNKFTEVSGTVELVTSGSFINRKAVVVNLLTNLPAAVSSVRLANSTVELYNSSQNNGNFSVTPEIVGIDLYYVANIILPTDTPAEIGDAVTVILDAADVFYSTDTQGSSNGTQVTIPSELVDSNADNIILNVTYIASINEIFSSAVTSLPASRVGNGFLLSSNLGFNNFSIVNISRRETQTVQENLSAQLFIEISLPSNNFNLSETQVVSVIRLSDGYELWTANNPGTIDVGASGNYQLILSGLNTPEAGDRVLVIYYADDVRRFQPFNYSNNIIRSKISTTTTNPVNPAQLFISLNSFKDQSGLNFSVVEPNTDIELFSGTDGYLIDNGNGTASFSSLTVDFSTATDLIRKKVKIVAPVLAYTDCHNDGTYDIASYNLNTNIITITSTISNISKDQIMVVRLLDGQEVWDYDGTLDLSNNRLVIDASSAISTGEKVFMMFFNYKNIKQSPTRIIGTTIDQVINPGVITVSGHTITKVTDAVFIATNTGLKLNLSEALRNALGLKSSDSLPSNVKIAKVIKAEKVITASATDNTVLEVVATYDVKNTTIQNNLYYSDTMLADETLQASDFILPSTSNNTLNTSPVNLPTIGDKIRITFYYVTNDDSENLSYTRNGTLYTNKKFALINKMFVASGFKSSQATKFTATLFTQPGLGARYKVFYDYTAPKVNERIAITYNYNKLIGDATFNVENSRPINADVLVKAAREILIDLTMNVVIDPTMLSSTTTILQDLRNQLNSALTATELNQIIDQVTLINIAQGVTGISRARILVFNKTGVTGQVLKIQAKENEFFSPNNVIINTETR